MKQSRILWTLGVACFCLPVCTGAEEPDGILGKWLIGDGAVCVEVTKSGAEYTGTIVWLRESTYPEGHALEGRPKIDRFNPDASRRDRPLLGLQVMEGLSYAGRNRWQGGVIYDADAGRTYRCMVTLESPDRLAIRGYVGLSLIGRTTSAVRCTSSFKREDVRADHEPDVSNESPPAREVHGGLPRKEAGHSVSPTCVLPASQKKRS